MVLEHQGERLLIDCGLMFPRGDVPGVEVVFPDFTWLFNEPDSLKGIVLTHAHEDHIGALPALMRRLNVPVWGTKFTLGLARHRLDEAGIAGDLREIAPRHEVQVGPFAVEPLRVAHSVPDAIALCVQAGGARVVHTGDFKLDLSPVDGQLTDLARLGELGERGVDLLLSDSTNAEVKGVTPSEQVVAATFERLFAQAKGRIVIALFGSHLHRVQHLLQLGARAGRKTLIWGRSLERNVRIARDAGALKVPDGLLVNVDALKELPDDQVLVVCTGAQAEQRSALMTMVGWEGSPVRIKPGDTVVLSSRTIPGNEPYVTELIDRVLALGARAIYPAIEPGVHVSGHAARDEQRKMIQTVRPNRFVPIHGELHHLHQHLNLAREAGLEDGALTLATDGDLLEIQAGGVFSTLGRVPVGRSFGRRESEVYVPGSAIDERRALAQGIVMCSVALAAGSGRLLAGPHLVGRGLATDEEAMLPLAAEAARLSLLELSEVLRGNDALVQEQVLAGIRRVFKQLSGRRPNVVAQVLRV
jgi:ribonuclease J